MTRKKYIAVGSAGVFRKVGLVFRMMRAFSERIVGGIFRTNCWHFSVLWSGSVDECSIIGRHE